MRTHVWKLHQWLGSVTCFALLMWGLSGALHPLMSWLQPVPAKFSAPTQSFDLSAAQPLKFVLEKQGIDEFTQVSVVQLGEQHCYRIQTTEQPDARYFSVNTGDEISDADQRYAEQLARHFTGLPNETVTHRTLVTAFNDDYPFIHRILPVWRIEFGQHAGLSAYIDTGQSRLATLSNSLRDGFTRWFRFAHNWNFLDDSPWLQLLLMLFLLGCVIFSALSGIYFYIVLRPTVTQRLSGQPLQRSHRLLGILFAFAALMSASSGIYHLIHGFDPAQFSLENTNETSVSAQYRSLYSYQRKEITDAAWQQLTQTPLARLAVARLNDQLVWLRSRAGSSEAKAQVAMLAQEQNHPPEHHPDANAQAQELAQEATQVIMAKGDILTQGEPELAQSLATFFAQRPRTDIVSTDLITTFTPEYGFINKRLPVYRIEFSGPEKLRLYIETSTSVLAARVVQSDVYEGLSFAWLHKWRFGFLDKTVQDALLVLVGLGNVVVACLGLTLFLRKRSTH